MKMTDQKPKQKAPNEKTKRTEPNPRGRNALFGLEDHLVKSFDCVITGDTITAEREKLWL
jgi:hypothetical protein